MRDRAPLGYLIHEVAKLMKRRFEDAASEHEVTLPQMRAMAEIATRGEISQTALAGCIDADPMTVSGILDRLEKRRLIERYPNPSDSRAKLARLSAEGERVVQSTREVGLNLFEAALEGVPPADRATAESVLKRMRENLSAQTAILEDISK